MRHGEHGIHAPEVAPTLFLAQITLRRIRQVQKVGMIVYPITMEMESTELPGQ